MEEKLEEEIYNGHFAHWSLILPISHFSSSLIAFMFPAVFPTPGPSADFPFIPVSKVGHHELLPMKLSNHCI